MTGALLPPHPLACPAAAQAGPDKHRATIKARAALLGMAVYELADGSMLACWKGFSRPCADWGEVQRLVRQVGGES